MATADAMTILQACQQAAQAASQAAIAVREASERRGNSYGEASKVVQCPKEFGSSNSSDDQMAWSDFQFAFKQWLFFAEPLFEPELKHIEERPTVVVTFHDNPQGLATRDRSKKLYSILAGIFLPCDS